MTKRKARAPKQARPKLAQFIWWHVCGESKAREYRAHGHYCAQCGAVGPEGRYVSDALEHYARHQWAEDVAASLTAQMLGVKA